MRNIKVQNNLEVPTGFHIGQYGLDVLTGSHFGQCHLAYDINIIITTIGTYIHIFYPHLSNLKSRNLVTILRLN